MALPAIDWTPLTVGLSRLRSQHYSYGVQDSAGRAVGGYAEVNPYNDGSGEQWAVRTFATRDGKLFGSAFPRSTRHPTREAAMHHAHVSLTRQCARFTRKFARPEVP